MFDLTAELFNLFELVRLDEVHKFDTFEQLAFRRALLRPRVDCFKGSPQEMQHDSAVFATVEAERHFLWSVCPQKKMS